MNAWAWDVVVARDELARRVHRKRGEIDRALGLPPGALSPSRLLSRKGPMIVLRVLFGLRGEGAFDAAVRLRLGTDGLRHLLAFRNAVLQTVFNVRVEPSPPELRRDDAVEYGRAGVELYRTGAWDAAVSFLQPAWTRLREEAAALTETELLTLIRTGTEYSSWLLYQGQTGEALSVTGDLEQLTTGVHDGSQVLAAGVAGLHTAAAMALRKTAGDPYAVVKLDRAANRLYSELGDRAGQIRSLRDQAKPLVAWGLGARGGAKIPLHIQDAEATLVQAERLAGGDTPREGLQEEWLFTRLTRVECSAVLGRSQEAEQLWNSAMDRPWVADRLRAPRDKPLRSKFELAKLAVSEALGRYDRLAEEAETFIRNPENAPYVDRRQQAAVLRDAAERGNAEALRKALLK